ncbi:hypothetical protein H6P81_009470 [Aristolochia fimbriata]|uniref:Uncharacterized protein n=1 Tax=Aristolochia fimbriata TaxID=158543 RepID=A0AAV7EL10_ARIFI|nr:hypothetical protein H6P81_009470 [Aristolochia fimbriata]
MPSLKSLFCIVSVVIMASGLRSALGQEGREIPPLPGIDTGSAMSTPVSVVSLGGSLLISVLIGVRVFDHTSAWAVSGHGDHHEGKAPLSPEMETGAAAVLRPVSGAVLGYSLLLSALAVGVA